MASEFQDYMWRRCKWKLLAVCGVLLYNSEQVLCGSCGKDDDKPGSRKNNDDNCWYELWYFWFILVLALLTIVVLVIFYCKQQVKRSSGRRGRRRTPVLSMPMAPPQYEAPGCQPPPYHIAMSTNVQTDPASPRSNGSGGCGCPYGNAPFSLSEQAPPLPGYVAQPQDPYGYDNISWASTISVQTLSNPPPYSPPHSSYNRQRQQTADVLL